MSEDHSEHRADMPGPLSFRFVVCFTSGILAICAVYGATHSDEQRSYWSATGIFAVALLVGVTVTLGALAAWRGFAALVRRWRRQTAGKGDAAHCND